MDRKTELILKDPFNKDRGLNMLFLNSRIKVLLIIWFDCESYGKNQYKKKQYKQHSSVFKELKTMNLSKVK